MTEIKGKNSKFMDLFGDLASDNTVARNKAGAVIVKYLIHTQGGALEPQPMAMCPDLEYSLRRLVRGLSSSRQSARQGFAACLCELLLIFDFITYDEVIELIDDTTKVTGSMKRAEERDVMFGKLFGYLTLIAANRVTDASSASDVSERLLVLYDKKPWMHEITTEALLSTLSSVAEVREAVQTILDKIAEKAILFGTVEEMSASQLMLLIGLQHHFAEHPQYNDLFLAQFSYKHPVNSLKKIESFAPALVASCSGYPKIHRIWDYLLSGVFGFDAGRHLCGSRLSALSPAQDRALGLFVAFVDKHLINSTQEKRGVAMALVTSIVAHVPINLLSKGLSQSVVRCLMATRMNKKHTLFVVAGHAIDAMVTSAVTAEEKLALATTFIQHGSPSFDAKTSTKAVASLLAGADKKGVLSHVASICGIVGAALASILSTPLCQPVREPQATKRATDLIAENEDENDSAVSVAISGIAELAGMMKNNALPGRAEVFEIVLAVLVRLSCFGVGGVKTLAEAAAVGKTPKKGKKKTGAVEAAATGFSAHVGSALAALEDALVKAGSSGAELNLPASITDAAASRLVSCIADMGHVSISQLESVGKPAENSATGPTVLDYATTVLGTFLAQGGFFCFHGYGVGNTAVDDFGEDSESERAVVADIVRKVLAAYKDLNSNTDASKQRVVSAFKNLLGQALFHVLITTDVSLETMVSIIAEVIPKMVGKQAAEEPAAKKGKTDVEEEDSDEDDEEESVQLLLFEGCVELLSVPGTQHPIKGIRDAIKKVWSAISQSFTIDYELVASVVEFIAGEEGADGEQSKEPDHGNDEDADEVDEEGSDDGSVDSQAEAIRAAMAAAAGGKSKSAKKAGDKRKRDESDSDDDDEEDEELGDDAFEMLPEDAADSSDEESDDDSEQGLQHTEEADDALVNMLQLKRQNRKKGLLEAKRIQLLNRTRAVDILEAIVSRNSTTGYLMVPMFTPLLRCLKKCIGSTFIRSLQEGRAFENRLKGLFEAKLCKEKFHLVSAEETSEDLCMEIDALAAEGIQFSAQLLNSTESVVRQVALSSFVALLRATVSTTSTRPALSEDDEEGEKPAKVVLVTTLQSVFEDLFSKRNSRVPVKLFHDVTDRFPDYLCEHLLAAIAKACSEAKTSFLRAEACKLINTFIKKFKQLSASSQQAVISAVSQVSYAVSQNLLSNASESADNKSKRLRPIMELSRDMLKLLIGQNKNGVSAESAFTIEQKSVDSLSQLTELDSAFLCSTKSSVVKRLAEQIAASIKQIPEDNIVNSDNKQKKKAGAATPGKKEKAKRKMSDIEEQGTPAAVPKSAKKAKKK